LKDLRLLIQSRYPLLYVESYDEERLEQRLRRSRLRRRHGQRPHRDTAQLLRKGRFDEVFFFDLPDEAARREIFTIHLRLRQQKSERKHAAPSWARFQVKA
jgi:hypothetical protein